LHGYKRINNVMSLKSDLLREKIEPLVEEEGLDIVEFKFSGTGSSSVLRIFVDKSGGVTVDQCASLSRKLGDFLDMEDLIPGRYTLEVSSPGLDRPLASGEDFKRKIGEKVKVFLKEKWDGKTELEGRIKDIQKQSLLLVESSGGEKQEEERIIPLEKVAKAKIIF
jgi:ribosome maturation factor RimP